MNKDNNLFLICNILINEYKNIGKSIFFFIKLVKWDKILLWNN